MTNKRTREEFEGNNTFQFEDDDTFQFEELSYLTESQQKQYITKYFIPLSNGNHLLFKKGKYEMINNDVITRTYLNRLPKSIKDYYTKEFTGIKTPVYQLNKPLFFEDNINLCPQLKEAIPYSEFNDKIKSNVQLMLDFILEVLSNNNKAIYDHLIKWLANMMKGNKNDSCIVLKTAFEGVGKSTLPEFILKHVLGPELALESGSDPLTSKFNSILSGKLFVFFEELETFSATQWMGISSILKRLITSEFTTYESKGSDRYSAENINNYFILSNHDVQDEGRRFFVLDINVNKIHDREYWNNLRSQCFNDEVGYAFYCYLRDIDTTNFRAQHFPLTISKTNSINKRLDSVFQFIKDTYILKKKGINCTVSELFDEYGEFCIHYNKKPHGKIDFNTKLSSVNINYYKSNGKNKFKQSFEDLELIGKKFNWFHELDEYETIEDDEDDETVEDDETIEVDVTDDEDIIKPNQKLIKNKEILYKENKNLVNENKALLKRIEDLEKLLESLQSKEIEVNEESKKINLVQDIKPDDEDKI